MGIFSSLFGRRSREEAFFREMVSAAAEGHDRAKVRQALQTLSSRPMSDDFELASLGSAELVRHLVTVTGSSLRSRPTLLAAGLLSMVISNHLSFKLHTDFEQTSAIGFLDLVGTDIFKDEMSGVIDAYNQLSGRRSKIIEAAGNACAAWVDQPSIENLARLAAVFDYLMSQLGGSSTDEAV